MWIMDPKERGDRHCAGEFNIAHFLATPASSYEIEPPLYNARLYGCSAARFGAWLERESRGSAAPPFVILVQSHRLGLVQRLKHLVIHQRK